MYWLILLNFIFFSLGQLTSLSRVNGLNIYFFDVFLIFSNLIMFIYIFKKGKFKINFPFLAFVIFLLYSFIFTLLQIYFFELTYLILVFSYLIRFSSYVLFAYFLYLLLLEKLLNEFNLKQVMKINFYLLTFLNFLQLIFLNDLTNLAQFGWDPHIGRLVGTFLDPNFMAFYLCLYFVLNHFFLKNKLIEVVSIISVFLTLSRNGILTLLIIYLILNIRNIRKIVIIFLLFLILILFNPRIIDRFTQFQNSDDSSYQRLISWGDALKLISFNNFTGVGFNNYRNNIEFYYLNDLESLNKNSANSTDSSLLHVLVTLGIVGIIFFLIFLCSFIYFNGWVLSNLVVLLALLFNSQFINSIFYPQISILIFSMLFLGMYLNEKN